MPRIRWLLAAALLAVTEIVCVAALTLAVTAPAQAQWFGNVSYQRRQRPTLDRHSRRLACDLLRDAKRVEDAVDVADGGQHVVEVLRIAHLERETRARDAITAGRH